MFKLRIDNEYKYDFFDIICWYILQLNKALFLTGFINKQIVFLQFKSVKLHAYVSRLINAFHTK